MSDVTYSSIVVTGAPVATGCNKSYYLDDTSATGYNRLWRTNSTQRIYWNSSLGWVIEDLNGSDSTGTNPIVYFYSNTQVEYDNPWDVTTWLTNIEAYQEYNPEVIGSTDPEITTETVTVSDYKYEANTDAKVYVGKTYYFKLGDKYLPADAVTIGKEVPENTYYVYDTATSTYMLFEQYRSKYPELEVGATFSDKYTYYTRTYTGASANPYAYVQVLFIGNDLTSVTGLYVNTGVKVVKTITTTTNHRTGAVTQSIVEEVISTSTTLDTHTRYALPEVEAGKIYRFAFVKDFAALGYIKPQEDDFNDGESSENDSDITRGIFRIDEVTTYYDMVVSGVDVYQNLYLPLGLSKEIFEQDKAKWMNKDVWYKLVNPMLEAQVYYIPTSIIEGIPDGNVTPYDRYHMIIDIGIFNDPELLTDMLTCVNMLFKAHFGVPTAAQLATYDKVYLPESYAKWMEEQREVNINQFMTTKGDQYYNTLFKNEYNELNKENVSLRTKVKTYEEIIGDLV